MQLTRLTAFTLLGFALGTAVALSVPHFLNDKLLVSAQSVSSETPSQDATPPQSRNRQNLLRKGRSQKMGQLFQNLNLTPDQTQKLKSIRQEYKDPIREQQRNLREARQVMQQMIGTNTPASTVLSKFQEVQQMQQSLSQLRFKSLLAMREVLTSAQRQQLAQQMMARQGQSDRKGLRNRPQK
jgi:periplasmic protein CpxP/Spy